jgi:Xaa-Pro aminopeptidase
MTIEAIQEALQAEQLDGWLFFDHHRRDPLAYHILGLNAELQPTRRWYYFIPVSGEARGLVHHIEPHILDDLPGEKARYSRWRDQTGRVRDLLAGARRIAMQFSPNCAIPYVAMVDAGTVDLVRSTGVEVVSSANLVQLFEARWTAAQFETHVQAGSRMDELRADAFDLIRTRLRDGLAVTEWDVRSYLLNGFRENGLVTDHGPIVAVNANASDPHYEPSRERHSEIRSGDLVLIDMWAKLDNADAVFYDITWTGFCGPVPPPEIEKVFQVVTTARDTGVMFVQSRKAADVPFRGYEVDDSVRGYIDSKGYGEYFIHRTGHSIGTNVHGAGANMDNFETHDERLVISRTCFSVEPGVYLPEFGIRSEVNVYVGEDDVQVTGEIQRELLLLA